MPQQWPFTSVEELEEEIYNYTYMNASLYVNKCIPLQMCMTTSYITYYIRYINAYLFQNKKC